ncbi:MAG: hypothetical protein LBP59_13945 [Planctomycetaceae bacterium]|nr:hypothetical protein [Planctomycetaceae bacterium]
MLQKIVRRNAGVSPGMRLYSTANERYYIAQHSFGLLCGKLQSSRLRSFSIFCYKKIVTLVTQKLSKRNLINKFL